MCTQGWEQENIEKQETQFTNSKVHIEYIFILSVQARFTTSYNEALSFEFGGTIIPPDITIA